MYIIYFLQIIRFDTEILWIFHIKVSSPWLFSLCHVHWLWFFIQVHVTFLSIMMIYHHIKLLFWIFQMKSFFSVLNVSAHLPFFDFYLGSSLNDVLTSKWPSPNEWRSFYLHFSTLSTFFNPIQFSTPSTSFCIEFNHMKRVFTSSHLSVLDFDDGKFIGKIFFFKLNSRNWAKGQKGLCSFYKVSIHICIMHFDVAHPFMLSTFSIVACCCWWNLLLFIIDTCLRKIIACMMGLRKREKIFEVLVRENFYDGYKWVG